MAQGPYCAKVAKSQWRIATGWWVGEG